MNAILRVSFHILYLQNILSASEAAKLFLILLVTNSDCAYSRHEQYLQNETPRLNISCEQRGDGGKKASAPKPG